MSIYGNFVLASSILFIRETVPKYLLFHQDFETQITLSDVLSSLTNYDGSFVIYMNSETYCKNSGTVSLILFL